MENRLQELRDLAASFRANLNAIEYEIDATSMALEGIYTTENKHAPKDTGLAMNRLGG